ncbi:beta-galactosidase [Kineosporia babensis]|uniref:Beta-galactosidase n=1 Tax=Kineosporia babensis TaxID=499548 RepID=A0A9X1SWL4_9ACTN|nr:beta-galactosidase [Kineosporia babensis]MCD5315222.1 beta-galactosidase [Kineosporia babensis]
MKLAEGLVYGGDYNPEQWTRAVWLEDMALMREAGVNLVTLGVFSWGLVETSDGVFEFGWLDEIVELLHENGIGINLATPTAAPPSWLHTAHPEILPRLGDLYQEPPGGRNAWCPSSPVFRRYALRIAEQLARRYGQHPAVRLWHVGNELGGGNARCYCDVSAQAFREWLTERHGTLEAVNQAWGTAFWGHRFGAWEEILPPRGKHGAPNPGLFIDYERYSSDALLAHYRAEREVLQEFSDRPVTTNMMVGPGAQVVDYARWAPHTDIAATDHYTLVNDPDRAVELACAGDRMRGMFADRRPWLLMEHSTGGPSWQQRNRAKDPGEILRNSLAHVARGSDGAMFFQWRSSTAGAEQFHSAMLPHAGTRSRVWHEVLELGSRLKALNEVAGSRVEPARAAMVVDDESGWYLQHGLKPHRGLRYGRELRAWHKALWERQVLLDLVPAGADLAGYDLVLVPNLMLVSDAVAEELSALPQHGTALVVTYLSGICEPTGRVRTGGYPGAFRDVLGAWSDEFYPLQDGEEVQLDDGGVVRDWTERVHLDGAEAVVSYASSSLSGAPAVTRRPIGAGAAWYVSAALSERSISAIVERLITEAGLPRTVPAPSGLEAVRRIGENASYLFLINHRTDDVEVAAEGLDLLTEEKVGPVTVVPAGGVRVVRENPAVESPGRAL